MKLNLKRYFEFINESVAKPKMRLHYSVRLRKHLEKMSNKNIWAKWLLNAENSNQIEDVYTLIDLTDKNDHVSFIQTNRVTRAHPELTKYSFSDAYFLPLDIWGDSSNKLWKEGRTEIAVGRWLRRLVTEVHKSTISDGDIEKFVNIFKAIFDGNVDLEIVEGEDIRKWYLSSNYLELRGSLGNSCMRYERCQPYLDIYVKNPEVCKMVIMKDESGEKITGRALIWKLSDGKDYMDRVYTINDSDQILFQQWSEKREMLNWWSLSGKSISVVLQNRDFEVYPYMDTFIIYDYQNLKLYNDESKFKEYTLKLNNTDGSGTEFRDNNVYSEWYGDYIEGDDYVWCENIQSYIYTDDAVFIEDHNEWAHPEGDDVCYSEIDSKYYFKIDCQYSKVLRTWISEENEDLIKIKVNKEGDTDWTILSKTETYDEIDGDYFGKNYNK